MIHKLLFNAMVWLAVSGACAQSVRYSIELGGGGASESQNPFWQRANQYGTVPLKGAFGTLQLGLLRNYRLRTDTLPERKQRFDWGFGIYAVANAGSNYAPNRLVLLFPDA